MNPQRRKRAVPPASNNSRSPSPLPQTSISSNTTEHSIDRLTAAMTNFFEISKQQERSTLSTVRGEVIPFFDPEEGGNFGGVVQKNRRAKRNLSLDRRSNGVLCYI